MEQNLMKKCPGMLHRFVGMNLVQTRCENLKFHGHRIYIPRLIGPSQRFRTRHALIQLFISYK